MEPNTQAVRHNRKHGQDHKIAVEQVVRVLNGDAEYDGLGAQEQALVRAYWSERAADLRASLQLDREFQAEGRSYVELDDDGKVVRRDAETVESKLAHG